MENRRSYYSKDISRSRPLFQKTDIAKESVCLRTIDIWHWILIFNSFADISCLKYVTKIFRIYYYFQEKIRECFKVQLQWLCLCTNSKGANWLQVLYIKTLGNIQWSFSAEAANLEYISSIFFLEICRRFRKTSQKLALENFVLAYHATDRITLILCKLSSLVFYINSEIYICLIQIEIIKDTTDP